MLKLRGVFWVVSIRNVFISSDNQFGFKRGLSSIECSLYRQISCQRIVWHFVRIPDYIGGQPLHGHAGVIPLNLWQIPLSGGRINVYWLGGKTPLADCIITCIHIFSSSAASVINKFSVQCSDSCYGFIAMPGQAGAVAWSISGAKRLSAVSRWSVPPIVAPHSGQLLTWVAPPHSPIA